MARSSVTVARGVTRSARAPPAPPPNETVAGSTPRLLQDGPLPLEAGRKRPLAVASRQKKRQRAGVQIVAHLQDHTNILAEWRRRVFRHPGNLATSRCDGRPIVSFTSRFDDATRTPRRRRASIKSARANDAGSSTS